LYTNFDSSYSFDPVYLVDTVFFWRSSDKEPERVFCKAVSDAELLSNPHADLRRLLTRNREIRMEKTMKMTAVNAHICSFCR
jgi:hypothetical protein